MLSTVTAYGLDNELAGTGGSAFEAHTANQVLKSAGGNYNDDNLSVGNVRPVAFGLSQTGDLSNLVATDAAYAALEATSGRNQVPTPLSAIPSPANGGPSAWNQLGVSREGTGGKIGGGGVPTLGGHII